MRRCGDLVMGEIPEAEARTIPADVTKAEANEPPEFTIVRDVVSAIGQLVPRQLCKFVDEKAAMTAWWDPALPLAWAIEQVDTQPGGKLSPGVSGLLISALSQPPDLRTLGAFAHGFQATE